MDGSDANGADANDNIVLEEDNSTTIAIAVEKVATLENTENILFKLPKRVVKTLLTATNNGATDTSLTIRRQFVGTTHPFSNAVSFTAGSNETFALSAEKDYTLTILTAGSGTGFKDRTVSVDGKILELNCFYHNYR